MGLWSGLLTTSCRSDDEEIIPPQEENVDNPSADDGAIKGFFLLNEGNMGSNKCTLDYYDAVSGTYVRNIYGQANPGVVQELGDVGSDIQIYDGKIWAVINCSHFVEVMDVKTAKHITQISIPNCRYITFEGDYAYVTSYAGEVQIDPNARLGYVAKIDVNTFEIVGECAVGYQPDGLAVSGNKLYVANSGGYRVPNYDRTVSVIDLNSFKVVNTIDVAINLNQVAVDNQGYVWVSSRGDYYNVPSKTYVIDPQTSSVCGEFDVQNSNMAVYGDMLYVIGSGWNYTTGTWSVNYAIINTRTRQVVSDRFITDGTESEIQTPYGLAINPDSGEIYLTDAGNYVSPGSLYCFSPDGKKKWSVRTGDIPAHIAFTTETLDY